MLDLIAETLATADGETLIVTRDGPLPLTATALGTVTTEHGYKPFGEPDSVTTLHGPDTLFEARSTGDPLGRITEIEQTLIAPRPGEGAAAGVPRREMGPGLAIEHISQRPEPCEARRSI